MKSLKILLVAGSVLSATGIANAGSSFTFSGNVKGAPSIVELGKKAENTSTGNAATTQDVAAQDNAAEEMAAGAGAPAAGADVAKETPQNEASAAKTGETALPAENADSSIDPTMTASAPEQKPFFEAAPFSASELRH